MSQVEVKIPSVGESINEATLGRWNFKDGDWVDKDAVIFEIETEKATMEVNAPSSGVIKVKNKQGDTVSIGATVATIDTDAKKPAGASAPASSASPEKTSPSPAPASNNASSPTSNVTNADMKGFGPSKRKAVREGRQSLPTHSSNTSSGNSLLQLDLQEGQERKPMSTIRKKIAERLIHSQHSTATLTTFNEVDMSAILAIRSKVKDEFQKKFGVKLGFMSFFTKAVVAAAKEVPAVNAFIEGTDILYNSHVHTSIAVSTDRGLVVPVLRFADRQNYADIEKNIGALAEKARSGKLGIEDMSGGTFTITNGGVFGSLLSTPILNPPQSGILGMHKTEMRPKAIEQANGSYKVEVRPMMYVALSYDHRVIDGRDSVTFLVKAKEYLETITAEEVMRG